MGIREKVKELACRFWTRAVTFCEAKDRVAEMRQRVNSATEAVEDARRESEKKISEAKAQAEYDIECANRDKAEAEQAIAEKQHDLELLKSRIDKEAIPIAEDLVTKAKKDATDAMRQAQKKKKTVTSWIGKIRKRNEFYENTDFDLAFEDVQDLRKTLENEYYNTERKLDAINNVMDKWDIPKKLRNRVDGDRKFLNSLEDEEPWIAQP